MAPEFRFHHGGVNVPDLEQAIAWYHDILGFDLERRFEIPPARARVAMVRKGAMRFEIFQVEDARPLPAERRTPITDLQTHGNKHVAFQVSDLETFLLEVESRGADIAFVVREGFGRGCFLRDCAGNLIEFVEETRD
ncbi:VOC family protein [Parahaliea maris]|uniref:VOC family protein n=1 Tax=Parahaliea maris TaxID=2716870 RepID=A0A5C8ZSM3_9GAMM|nr:VOC family protein [Parahaliea maris]TXS90301.1 VOC family protein [Parahaliea maris]